MLIYVSRTATKLKSIMVKSAHFNIRSRASLAFAVRMTSLETLVINADWTFADEDLSTLAELFPNLKSLSVSYKLLFNIYWM
jgi:hypothetical protein